MKRRHFLITAAGFALLSPLRAGAEAAAVKRIGVLLPWNESDRREQDLVTTFRQELAAKGWIEGKNLLLEARWVSADALRLKRAASELVASRPDAILASSPPAIAQLRSLTNSVPIVIVQVNNPAISGLVASFAHPGGNVTGISATDTFGKWVQLIKEIAPATTRLLAFDDPSITPKPLPIAARRAARSGGLSIIVRTASTSAELEPAIAAFAKTAGGALLVLPDPFNTGNGLRIVQLARRYRLPAVYRLPYFARAGGLIAYGDDQPEEFREAASYVDRILKGANPGDLPIVNPTRYDLVINLRASKALGLRVPESILLEANEIVR